MMGGLNCDMVQVLFELFWTVVDDVPKCRVIFQQMFIVGYKHNIFLEEEILQHF